MPLQNDSGALGLSLILLWSLLGATTSLLEAAGLVVVVLGVIIISEGLRVATARFSDPALATGTAVLVWTGAVVAADLALQAYWPGMHRGLGVFVPVLAATGLLRTSLDLPGDSLKFGKAILVFCMGALVLGAAREWAGLVASLPLLPPGALILSGLLLAGWNAFRLRSRP